MGTTHTTLPDTIMGICVSLEEQVDEHAAWLAGGKEICINCRISAGEFDEKIEVSLNQRLSVSTAKTAIVQKSSYEHKKLVAAGDVVLEMGNTALDDAQTLEDEGVEENATLTVVVDAEAIEGRRLTDETVRDAVKLWCDPATRQAVVDTYGEIGDWNVSAVTNMTNLFLNQKDFNENISRWDTSNVTSVGGMFEGASSFNQPVEGWNTANVRYMSWAFHGASSFNQSVEGWNTAHVREMGNMFDGTSMGGSWFLRKPSLIPSWYKRGGS